MVAVLQRWVKNQSLNMLFLRSSSVRQEEIDVWCQNEGCELPVYLFANKCDLLTEVQDSFLAGAKMEKTCREAVSRCRGRMFERYLKETRGNEASSNPDAKMFKCGPAA